MAGGIAKGFGGILLALGILLIIGGLGALAVGFFQLEDAGEGVGDSGFLQDQEKEEQAQAIMAVGAVAAVVGLLVLVLGIVLLAIGGARSRKAIERAIKAQSTATAPSSAGALGAQNVERPPFKIEPEP